MPIIIKLLVLLLLAALFLFQCTDSTDGIALEKNVASTNGEEVISGNEDGEIEMERSKRLYTEKIKESLGKIKLSLEKTITDKLENPILGSIRSSPLLKGKSKLTSLLDTYKSSKINLAPPPCPHQTLPTQETIPTKDAIVGAVASISTQPPSKVSIITDDSLGAAHTPVVLPEHLRDNDTRKKNKTKSPNRITTQQWKETSVLRKEINYAVKHGIYVHSASEVKNMNQKSAVDVPPSDNVPPQYLAPEYYAPTTPTPPPPQYYSPVFPTFDNFYSNFWQDLFGRQQRVGSVHEQSLGSARSDFSYVPDENPSPDEQLVNHLPNEQSDDDSNDKTIESLMAKAAEQMRTQGIVSNTVESYANSEGVPYVETNRVREELNITSVTEDMRFNIGENVIGWRTLQRNKRESHALIGITNTSVLLVLETNGVYKLQVEKHLLSSPTFFITYTYWNETQQSIDGIVIVSIQYEIVFLRVNEAMDKMEVIWIWPTNNIARYLHHLVLDNSDTLLIITDLHGGSAASLYRFDMNEEVFFLRQSLSLKTRSLNMALIQSGFDTFMCFPQRGHAVIYKYNKDHFRYFTKIESTNATILSSFEMGGYSYLAIGGTNSKILRYHRGQFQDQTILSKSWGNVEFFLPVPARTYRDDLILFVQHRMDYGSHTNSYLEALIWNGQAFHPALQVPCYINDHVSEFGLGCMLDEDRDLGIIGATMFQRNRSISIIVPRHEAPSGLFDLEIDLLPAASTLNEHLLELLSEVIIMLDIRDQVLVEARELIDNFPKDPMKEVTIKNQNLDIIYTQDLDMGSLIPTDGVYLGDELVTKKIVDEFLQIMNETETNIQLLEELKRNKREDTNIIEHLHLKSVNVSELNVRYINDIPFEDLVFVEDGNLKLDGTVVLNQTIEPVFVERAYDGNNQLLGEEPPDTTVISGDLTFEELNGIKWKDFVNQIVLKHLPNNIDDMEVLGDVIVEDTVTAQTLNDIPFPSGYISTESAEEIVVTGRKVFKNVLVTETIDVFETFNGVQLSQVVMLNSPQFIPATTTFRHLEVLETLEMAPNATISGRRLDEFLANPTLSETKQIRSTVFIDTLEIEGPLYIRNTMDNVFLDDILGDVVYKHEPAPQIDSFKKFESIQAPNIQLTANLINGIPFSSFVTTDTEQTFDVSKLYGNFYFQKLKLDGLFNFINVTELDLNSLKLLGEQYTDAEFTFADGNYLNIDVNQLEVLEAINGIDVHNFINIDEDFEFTGNVKIDSLKVDELILDGEIKGSPNSLINGFSLQNLLDTHLSKNNPQNIAGSVYIPTAVLRNGINSDYLNGYDFKSIVNILKNIQTNEQMLNESSVIVDQMFVNGSIWFRNVNGFDLDYYTANAIHLDQTNNMSIPITFLDSIYVNGNINVEQLNGENFNEFTTDLVRKSADVTRVYGTTIFKEDVTITNNAEITTINEIQVDRILTKNYNREIFNKIQIVGDVTIPNLFVKGELNGVSGEDLNSYHYDDQNGGRFVLNKDIFFNESIGIKYFNVHGGYDNIGNLNEYLKNIIRTDRPAVVTGRKTFTDTIHFEKGIDMIELNGVNVPKFLENIVLIDQLEPVNIFSDVVFAAPIIIPHMKIDGNLITETINNCSVADWVQNTIRTDQPFDFDGVITFPDGTCETANINAEFLNENPMNEVITLNTEQTFDQPVHFNYVYSSAPITADGFVSGYDIPKERANTLMVYGTQYIEIPTVFQSIRVLNNLVTDGLVNRRDLRLAASLQQGNILIDSPLSFGSVYVDRLYTSDLISGINFDNWFDNALLRYKLTPQIITAPWTIKNAIISTMNVAQGINDMDVNQFLQSLDQSHRQYQNNYKQKCQVAQNLIQNTQKNVIFLSHFANTFTIDTQNPINSVYHLNYFNQNYFLVNSGCQTLIHVWNETNGNYAQVNSAITGDAVEWIHVLDHENQLFLIANNDGSVDSNCPISGAFVWRFNPMDNGLNQEVQFGHIGEFRSMQMKPNSHALFYVIRNADSHVIEYNLRGAIVTEFNIDNAAAPPKTSSVRFVPVEAQLGLAISDGNQLSILTACNCTRRTKRCGLLTEITAAHLISLKTEHRQNFERSMEQLRTDLKNGRTALRSILTSSELNQPNNNMTFSLFNQTKIENMKDLIRKSKEKIAHILSWDKTSPNSKLATEKVNTSTDPIIKQTYTSTIPLNRPVSSFVSTVSPPTSSPILIISEHNATQLNIDAIQDQVVDIDEVMTKNKSFESSATPSNNDDQKVEDDSTSVGLAGADLVNLMDLIDKVIEENKDKHKKVKDDPENVGLAGPDLVNLMDLIDKVIKKNEEKHQQENSDSDTYENTYRIASQLNRTEIKQMLNDSLVLNELMSISNTTNQTDPHVGTLFGMFMLEKTFANTLDRASKILLGGDDENQSEDGARSATDDGEEKHIRKKPKGGLFSLLGTSRLNFTTDDFKTIPEEARDSTNRKPTNPRDEQKVGDPLHSDRPIYVYDRLVDHLSDKIIDKVQKQQNVKEHKDEEMFYAKISQASIDSIKQNASAKLEESKNQEPFKSMHEIVDDFDLDSVDHILGMISEAENITNEANLNETEDPSVGDEFGDIMFKLTPVVDKIMDKIADELRRRKYERDQYFVGSVQSIKDAEKKQDLPMKVIEFFRNIGKALVKYMLGKNHLQSMRSITKDIKHLYHVYYDELKNDKETKEIFKAMPKAKEFAHAFAVEMVKLFTDKVNSNGQSKGNIWMVLRTGVKAAFNLHAKNSGQNINGNEFELDEKIYDKFMHELNETVANVEHTSENDLNETVGSTLSTEVNQDPLPIDKQLSLLDRFAPLIDHLSDKVIEKVQKQQNTQESDTVTGLSAEQIKEQEPPKSMHKIVDDFDLDSVDHILGMISEAENITNKVKLNETEDPSVGDEFGDIMFKLTPVADKIMDKIADELRRRKYERDQYLLGSAQQTHGEDDRKSGISKVYQFFRKIGRSLVKVYTFGRDHYQTAKNLASDAKFLYFTYFDNFIEDNQNDNKTYGPPEVHVIDDKFNESVTEPNFDIVDMKNLDVNNKSLDDQLNSIELKHEMEIISKVMPNSKEFAQVFAVEMIKMLAENKNTGNSENATFWPVIRNAVKAAFELHLNNTHGNESKNTTDANQLIFKRFMSKLIETIELEQNKSNMSSEVVVGSVFGESIPSETKNQMLGSLFTKFNPLIDVLSDTIVTKLQKQNTVKESDEEPVEERKEETSEEHTEENATESVEEIIRNFQVDDGTNFKMENTKVESGCTRNITMQEFEQKLNEWKPLHGNTDIFPIMNPFRSATESDETSKPQFEKTKLETTVISIPNLSLPSHSNGEIIAIRIGPTQQLLIAVSSITEHTIKSDHDRIQIFEDVVDGKLFQTIPCYKPRSLITFNINMDTILAFIQDESEVKTYIFRGTQGFVEFTSFTMPSPIKKIIHNEIVIHPTQFTCPKHFLILVLGNQVEFMRAVTIGDCKIDEQLNC